EEVAKDKPAGAQDTEEQLADDGAGPELLPQRVREEQGGPDALDLHEAPIELQPEVLVQSRGGFGRREDHRDVAPDLDTVQALQDELVREHTPRRGQRLRCTAFLEEIGPALERAVRTHERAPEGWRRVERAQLEGIQGRSVLLFPEGRRKQRTHDQVDEGAMVLD